MHFKEAKGKKDSMSVFLELKNVDLLIYHFRVPISSGRFVLPVLLFPLISFILPPSFVLLSSILTFLHVISPTTHSFIHVVLCNCFLNKLRNTNK